MVILEVSEYLVGSAAFKAVGCGDPTAAGSIPVHLRFSQPAVVLRVPRWHRRLFIAMRTSSVEWMGDGWIVPW